MPIYYGTGLDTVTDECIVVHLGYGDVGVVTIKGEDTGIIDEMHFIPTIEDNRYEIGQELNITDVKDTVGESKAMLVFDDVESVDVVLTQLMRIKYSLLNKVFGDMCKNGKEECS